MTPLLRLLQITDSAFPVGGYAYSHGLEWLAEQGVVSNEPQLAALLEGYVSQVLGSQSLPAGKQAFQSTTLTGLIRIDDRLDASIAAKAERDAGRAMGERLLSALTDEHLAEIDAYRHVVASGRAPGQYAVAFGVIARGFGVALPDTLAALGFSMVNSVVQAGVRLGVVGQNAGVRLTSGAGPAIECAVDRALAARRGFVGAFTPGLDVASLLQPSLPFRMFAS